MYPIVPYRAFTMYTPSIPEFYKNIYSSEEGIKKILFELSKIDAYLDTVADALNEPTEDLDRMKTDIKNMRARLEELARVIDELTRGGRARNPQSGMYDLLYVIFKQMYDTLRLQSMTWRQMYALNKTWDELAEGGKTYLEVDMLANTIWGDHTDQIKYTDPAKIDVDTPGYKEVI